MHFLDRLDTAVRTRLLNAGRTRRLDPGQLLIRRGERGGDIFLVQEGSFEVVDTRSSPEVVFEVVGAGSVLGEISFLDAAPRSADVRATGVAVVRVWDFEGLHRVLESDPALAAPFFRALAETSVERLRSLATSASLGGLGPAKAPAGLGGADGDQARAIASRVQGLWLEADVRLRRDAMDAEAEGEVRAGFALLLQEATAWLRSFSVAEAAAEAGASLSRELRPYLARSELAQLCLDPPAGRSGHPRQLAHVLLADATGDDALGRTLDACILALPTCAALRARASIARTVVEEALPEGRPPRILLVNATGGALLASLIARLARGGAVIHAMDGSREALAFLDAGIPARPASVELKLLQQDLGALVLGRAPLSDSAHDVIVLDSLVDYLPDRLVASLLSWASGSLAPGGSVVITGLAPSPDAALFDHVLRWPIVRRSGRQLCELAEAVGFDAVATLGRSTSRAPAVVVVAQRKGH